MAATKDAAGAVRGGGFLLRPVGEERFLVPERFSEEQRAYFRTADEFVRRRIVPSIPRLEEKDLGLLAELLREAGDLGFDMMSIPEAHGGLALDETTVMLVGEAMARYGSWSVTHGGHIGIGSLPIVWFGTAEQKARYLPELATGRKIAAYALTEPGSGSDALGARTVARREGDGFLLTGTKQWITNAGIADVFIVFAKVDGEKFTAFVVERGTPGLTIGREEDKVGLRGSSTCQLILEDARVPAGNVLGEIGKGHKVAFNILNNGRLKLGVAATGGMKNVLEKAATYARERRAFGKPIAEFPLIREKLAHMAATIHVIESMSYRTTGAVDELLAGEDHGAEGFGAKAMAAAEEMVVESSILKVVGSEALTFVVDEAVQIHGGYGYMEEYDVARAYRDVRINRIFEGTNEINRMLIPGMLLKRAARGFPLPQWIGSVAEEVKAGALPQFTGPLAAEKRAAECTKRMAAVALGTAAQALGSRIEERQEVLAAIADVCAEAYAVDSVVGRTLQVAPEDPVRTAVCRFFAHDAWERALSAARKAVAGSVSGAARDEALAGLARLHAYVPYDPAEVREPIAAAVLDRGGYPWPY